MQNGAYPSELPLFDGPSSKPPRRKPKHYARRDAILDARLGVYEKAVLHAVLRHMGFDDDAGERAGRPSVWRIALMASVSEDTVNRAVKALEARGVLKVARLQRQPSRYRIVWARLAELADPRLAPGYKRSRAAR